MMSKNHEHFSRRHLHFGIWGYGLFPIALTLLVSMFLFRDVVPIPLFGVGFVLLILGVSLFFINMYADRYGYPDDDPQRPVW